MWAVISFAMFTGMVAVISYLKTRDEDLGHSTGYFLAGRSLSWFVIAGSLFLTNISAEQLTGLNGNAFASGANVMAWETIASIAMVFMAVFFLPRYMKSGITTVPQFLEARFGRGMRTVASFIFLYALIIGFLPFVLYAGGITLGKLFDVSGMLGVSDKVALWIMITALGIVGGCYAVFGGLKAVAVSDTINGIGLVIGGFTIPVLALWKLGDSSIIEGWNILLAESPERLQAAGTGPEASVPWHTLFTGILIINLFYWCTNQAIVQRTFGAKNLAEGQKGVLAASFMKVLGVAMLVLPGIIAWHMHQRGMINVPVKEVTDTGETILTIDMAYPLLVRSVLPPWMTGFFGAVMFGAILSSFNSGLNSMSTLFSVDIYKKWIKKDATDSQMVKAGKIFGTILIAVCILIAPAIGKAEGLYTLMRTIMAVINVPILAVILMGVISKRAPALAGFIALPVGMVFFYTMNFVLDNNYGLFQLHWLHTCGLNLVLMLSIMTVVRYLKPMEEPYVQKYSGEVNITTWKYAWHASWFIIVMLAVLYTTLSKIGIIDTGESAGRNLAIIWAVAIASLAVIFTVLNKKKNKNNQAESES
ncbi:MAG: solute:sodium symporter family transporter [Puniceicoccaceae bacterium]